MNPFIELFSILFDLYISVILLRFFLQYFKADYYNPLSQLVIKVTDPLVKPLRKIIPGFAGLDISTLVLAWIIALLKLVVITSISGQLAAVGLGKLAIFSLFAVINSAIGLYVFLIFARIILSFIAPAGHNPMIAALNQLTEPLLGGIRRHLPATNGFDLSPLILLLALYFIRSSIGYFIMPLFN